MAAPLRCLVLLPMSPSPSLPATSRVLVIGGGAIGLMTAWLLAEEGVEVLLLERGEIGREASWAGGGIISPLYPWRYAPPVTALARYAQEAYPELSRRLHELTGIDPEHEACGMLMLDAEDSRDAQAWAVEEGAGLERLGPEAMQARFGWLAPGHREGLWMPGIANIRNPRLLRALRARLEAMPGVTLREGLAAEPVLDGGRCRRVRLVSGELLEADAVVVCGGAWSGGLLERLGHSLPVRPIQGQMVLYKVEPGALPCMVMHKGRYLIPRRDGHVLCGSTLEDVGFDKHTTPEAGAELVAVAQSLWPALRALQPVAHWAGLRPFSPNGIPFIGPVPGVEGLWVNAGQYRNGLVLAPASARLLADLLTGREPVVNPAPYRLLA